MSAPLKVRENVLQPEEKKLWKHYCSVFNFSWKVDEKQTIYRLFVP